MQITQQTERRLVLGGRRQDGELGQTGLWLLWLVASVMLLGGVAFARLGAHRGMRVVGSAFACGGALLALFGLLRWARRESLEIECNGRTIIYATRFWPARARVQFEAPFADVKKVRVRSRRESPGGSKQGASVAYDVWEARLLIRPRSVVELARSTDETQVRRVAEAVARALLVN